MIGVTRGMLCRLPPVLCLLLVGAAGCAADALKVSPEGGPDFGGQRDSACAGLDGGVAPPAPGESLADACARLYDARRAWESKFLIATASVDRRAMIDSCVGLATLPGSTIQPTDIERCVEALRPGCHGVWNWYPKCLGWAWNLLDLGVKGTRPAGAACRANLQCASGLCTGGLSGNCGVCKNPRELGDPCDDSVNICQGALICELGVCVRSGTKLGEPCSGKSPDCQATLHCNHDNVCAVPIAVGGACESYEVCASGSYCRAGTCTPYLKDGAVCPDAMLDHCTGVCHAGRCQPWRHDLDVGEDCTLGVCAAELYCDAGVCVRPRYGGKGDSCAGGCGFGLTCDGSTFSSAGTVCVEEPKAGSPCTHLMRCDPNAVCVGFSPATNQTGTCVRSGGEGEACPCDDALYCVGGVCQPFGVAFDCK